MISSLGLRPSLARSASFSRAALAVSRWGASGWSSGFSAGGAQTPASPADAIDADIEIRLSGCDRYADLGTDHFTGNHQSHPPILLPSTGRIVGSHRLRFAEAFRGDRTPRHSLRGEIFANRLAAMFGELLIIVVAADAIRMT